MHLSGGSLYFEADIYAMDDSLSSVDSKVSENLLSMCLNSFLDGDSSYCNQSSNCILI